MANISYFVLADDAMSVARGGSSSTYRSSTINSEFKWESVTNLISVDLQESESLRRLQFLQPAKLLASVSTELQLSNAEFPPCRSAARTSPAGKQFRKRTENGQSYRANATAWWPKHKPTI
jgi:hypothetical protein